MYPGCNRVAAYNDQLVFWVRPQSWRSDLEAEKLFRDLKPAIEEALGVLTEDETLRPQLNTLAENFAYLWTNTEAIQFNIQDRDRETMLVAFEIWWLTYGSKQAPVEAFKARLDLPNDIITVWASQWKLGQLPFSLPAHLPGNELNKDQIKTVAGEPESF